MRNADDLTLTKHPSQMFSKTAREWILSSALYDGIEDEDIRQIETLLEEKGADPNVLLPEYGITPFHLVVANENIDFAVRATDICLQHGADPNVRSEDGLTPVQLAAMWGCKEVLLVLLASGGNPWLKDCLNKNAFDYALIEGQQKCYEILTSHCGGHSRPKPSGQSKSPYKLNLRRVILYNNDLQIIYDASPTKSRQCISTQTSPLNSEREQDIERDQPKDNKHNNQEDNRNKNSSKSNKSKLDQEHIKKTGHLYQNQKQLANYNNHQSNIQTDKRNKLCNKKHDQKSINGRGNSHQMRTQNVESNDEADISVKLKDVIVKHRRNMSIFEYTPVNMNGDVSYEDNSSVAPGLVSELVDKLERTNKIRQSLKSNEGGNDVLRNITQRRKPCHRSRETPEININKTVNNVPPKNDNGSICERNNSDLSSRFVNSSIHSRDIGFILNDSASIVGAHSSTKSQNTASPPSIGFILNDSASYVAINSSTKSHIGSPSSIGFILDHLDETASATRGSSLFSDIDSDVDAQTAHGRNESHDNIMTEDDSHSTKLSSSGSLQPYVSCKDENTRGRESSDMFESCLEKTDTLAINNSKVLAEPSKSENSNSMGVNSVMDSILNLADEGVKTPVNTKLVTSTPDKTSSESEDGSFISATDKKVEPTNPKWVEAKILSSDEEEPFVSISEEYEYTDMDEGVVLLERRYLLDNHRNSDNDKGKPGLNQRGVSTGSSEESEVSTISGSDGAYDTDDLRRGLQEHGFTPGPITSNTKRLYLRKLKRFRKKPQLPPQRGQPAYSPELLKTLAASCEHLLYEWAHLEDSMSASFACSRSRPWREGNAKTSFTYLLLDPRLAHDIPACATSLPHAQLWPSFLQAIFYVGKGKRSRPYNHLYEAVALWNKRQDTSSKSKKIQRILDIWKSGDGVVCLHVFLNIIPVEAYTREAAMISALTLQQLTNEKAGEFYGSASCWNLRLKCRLGCVLLHRAYKVFLAEGERQLRPADID